ncbi:TlyA family rRNA (cytidine-2'-O)-methyltransferase [Leptolyngbya sp. 'hensonii']|uniref:TlyA family RNA methyltransferase n=1 Tax=Leptolyngbya sp. 'hensonii' TaxID=1922337 RepID=UPI00094FF9E7|nr:TlyA family RNA methyltransferase [Leptolyngbya sp. 'hensonii']OLP17858.1 TlyA family rRNA (cytidine-2'-O)-methyltransferase [Leptolyngbya sp. 'hensonii']
MAKRRLDTLLVELSLCDSRQQAQRLIQAGEVTVNRQVIDKPGTEVDLSADIQIKQKSPYVSRGGEKLAKALTGFAISVHDRVCLDGGISTGGFTDCLLQAGAKQVYGIDVGYGQVAWSLRQDPRVILHERTNLRYLDPEVLYETAEIRPDLAVVDVSFISLTKVLPALWKLLSSPREMVLLVKPQFEVGRAKVGKNGVVREARDQAEAIWQVLQAAQGLGWGYHGLTWSPLLGPAGNIEYLLWLRDNTAPMLDRPEERSDPPDLAALHRLTRSAQTELHAPP